MDVPTANQSQTPYQPQVGQNGWSTAQEPPFNPLPSFQYLGFGSPSEQRPCYNHLQASNQGFHSSIPTVASRNDTRYSPPYLNDTEQTVQQIMLDANLPPMVPAASQKGNIPPCSPPTLNRRTQPHSTHQTPFNSSHGQYQAISPTSQHSYTHQGSLNGPQSPLEERLPVSSPSFGQCVNQNPLCSPRPALGRAHVESCTGYMHSLASPTSPIQYQPPPWTLPPLSIGRFVCNMYRTCSNEAVYRRGLFEQKADSIILAALLTEHLNEELTTS